MGEVGKMRWRRWTIAGLSTLGLLDSLYMLAYHEGWIDSLVCPFFGEGCNIVGRSKQARHFGVPNAAVGAVGYAAMGLLALAGGKVPPKIERLRKIGLAGASSAAALASAYLIWEQKSKVKAWCFWCLTSATINALILPLTVAEAGQRAGKALRSNRRSRK
jgi:uncharacterized membrane protein